MKQHNITITVLIMMIILVAMFAGYLLMQNNKNKEIHAYGTNAIHMELKQNTKKTVFNDGLGKPQNKIGYKPDETGTGTTKIETFLYDINTDGKKDKITRIHHENGTAHFWDEYTIEINENDRFRSIELDDFRTINGAECTLQKLKFIFKPTFQVIKISRPWVKSWNTPSIATKTTYELKNNQMIVVDKKQMANVCDVTELFIK